MIFDDIFYPGNKSRRNEIMSCNNRLRITYLDYRDAWNKWASLLNTAFAECPVEKFHSAHIELLKRDINKDTLGDCLTEIQNVAKNADETVKEIIKIMDITPLLPTGWEQSGIRPADMEKSKWLEIGKILSTVSLAGITGYLGYYVMNGVIVMNGLIAAVKGVALSMSGVLGGVAAGLIAGAAGFIITDMISSAITGAIERKHLKEAIEICRQLERDVTEPLRKAKNTITNIYENIEKKDYNLGDNYHLVGNEDGSFEIVKVQYIRLKSAKNFASEFPEEEVTQENRIIKASIPFIPVA